MTILARTWLSNKCAKLIAHLKETIHDPEFLSRHRVTAADFTRNRLLTFPRLITFMINLVKGAIQDELDHFFKALEHNQLPERVVTKSAFSQARRKMIHTALVELNRRLVDFFYTHFDRKTWRGRRVLAIDGSIARIPTTDESVEYFGQWHSRKGESGPRARLSLLHDVLNNITLDALIAPKNQGERILAAKHLKHIRAVDLILLDRGYPAFWLFALILSTGADFCARASLTHWVDIDEFFRSGKPEARINLLPSPVSIARCRKLGLSANPLPVRLVRVTLDNGQPEILITSLLDAELYPHHVFRDLYHRRWGVEERYKALKSRLEIENFSGFGVEVAYQDFHAKIFSANLTAVLVGQAQGTVDNQNRHRIHQYKINFSQAISKMKDVIVLLFSEHGISEIIDKLWNLMIKTIEPVRRNRKSPRSDPNRSPRFHPRYKPTR